MVRDVREQAAGFRDLVPVLGVPDVAAFTFGCLVLALVFLLLSIHPRVGRYSNGPDAGQMAQRIDQPAASLERELVPSFVAVRNRNEAFIADKAGRMIKALRCLFGAVVGLGVMVAVGAVS